MIRHRWTKQSAKNLTENLVDSSRAAFRFSLYLQLSILLLSATMLDHGIMFRRVAIATIAYLILFLLIMLRRNTLTITDVVAIKWGFIPILVVTFAFASRMAG